MSKIPYRHQEILQTLNDNPKGLTAAEIFRIAHKQAGSELPDASTVGKLIYAMRNGTPKLVTSSDAAGGNIHKITEAGRAALADALGEPETPAETLSKAPDVETAQPTDAGNPEGHSDDFEIIDFDMTDTLDRSLHGLVHLIRQCAEQPSIAIERKREKVAMLEQLESATFISSEYRALLMETRLDLEQLEDAA